MTAVPPDQVRRVGIVGAGVIGGGWAVHYLRMGLDVDVYDPAPAARSELLRMRAEIWPLLERIGLRPGASADRLVLHADLAGAVSDADMVQENAPENSAIKRAVLADIDRLTRPDSRDRVEHLRIRHDTAAGRLRPTRTLRGRPSVQPALPHPAGRGRRRGADRALRP